MAERNTAFRQGSTRFVALTSDAMTDLDPRSVDAGAAPSSAGGAGAVRAAGGISGAAPTASAPPGPSRPAPAAVPSTVPHREVPAGRPDDGADARAREGAQDGADAEIPASEATVFSRAYRALTLGIISVVSLIAFEASAVTTVMPVAAERLDGVELYAFAFSGYFTSSLFAMTLSGEWCDRRGPLAPLFTGVAAFGAGLVVAGSATQMWMFIAGRGVQGVGGGLVIVSLYGRRRPRLPAAAQARRARLVLGRLGAARDRRPGGGRHDRRARRVALGLPRHARPGAAAADGDAVRAAHAAAGRAQRGDGPLPHPAGPSRSRPAPGCSSSPYRTCAGSRCCPAVAGAALLVPCVLRLLPTGTFRAARVLPSVVLLRGLAAGTFLGAESFVPLMLVTERGLSSTMAGLSLTGGGLTWALSSYAQSRPRLDAHRERLMGLGMLMIALSIALAATALIDGVPAWIVAASWVIGGFGMGVTISGGSVLLLKLSRPEDSGSNAASLQVSDALGNISLVGASGVLFVAFGSGSATAGTHDAADAAGSSGHPAAFAAVLLGMAGMALVGAFVTTRLRPGKA